MIDLALAYLRDRPLTTALNVLLLAISTAMLILLLQFGSQVRDRFERDVQGVDLVVGAKGSPLQLILSSLFHIDQPTGNIPLESLDMLRNDPAIARAVPLALGDNFRGYRIVGTDHSFAGLYDLQLAQGAHFDRPMQAVLGADVAAQTGATLGQKFIGSHGFATDEDGAQGHDHAVFETVGILRPSGTVADRLILVSYQSVWDVHGIAHDGDDFLSVEADHADTHHDHDDHAHENSDHDVSHRVAGNGDKGAQANRLSTSQDVSRAEPLPGASRAGLLQGASRASLLRGAGRAPGPGPEPELTAILVTYRNASAAVRVPAMIDRQTQMQAAVPAIETARLLGLLGASFEGLRIFAWLLAMTGGLAIFVALLNMARARESDLALLRVMGASRMQVFATVILEGAITALLGALAGWLGAHALLSLARANFPSLAEMGLNAWGPLAGEAALLLAVLAIGTVAAFVPALRVYRLDPAHLLARG
ncbi:MAG: ABC transporter permease [Pseudomonadota bacterium]